jgi:hypothetical protein
MNAYKTIIKRAWMVWICILPYTTFSQNDTVINTDVENSLIKNDSLTIEIDSLNEVIMTEAQMEDFKDKALRKTRTLSNYISVIADKSKDNAQRDKAIDLAVKLFISEDKIVEVSSLNTDDIKRFKVREYFIKLKLLPYSKVTIEWFDIFYASDFKKRTDGRFEAVATIFQRFSGITEEGGAYIDITKKNITIIIDKGEIMIGTNIETYWDIFLGDIKVVETKKA